MLFPWRFRVGLRAFVSLLLMSALSVSPLASGMPSNGTDSPKDTNRPSLELNFMNKLVKIEGSPKSQGNSNGSAPAPKPPAVTDVGAVPLTSGAGRAGEGKTEKAAAVAAQEPVTKENSRGKAPTTQKAPHRIDAGNVTTPWPNLETAPRLPYYLGSEAIERAQSRQAPPSFPLDGGLIREGDAEPSRGRAGSPRRIDNFPPLQNQPGREYLDAISRRTIVPLPGTTTTTTTTTAKPTTAKRATPATFTTKKPAPISEAETLRSPQSVDATTDGSESDIGTAFALSEDFTQGFLGFPVSALIPDAVVAAENASSTGPGSAESVTTRQPIPHPNSTTNDTVDNFIESTPKLPQTTTTKSTTTTTATKPTTTTKTSLPPPRRNSTSEIEPEHPASETNRTDNQAPADNQTGGGSAGKSAMAAEDDADTDAPVKMSSAPPTTTASTTTTQKIATASVKTTTKRPYLRRRLPSFRATSPRPTVRRRQPQPPTTTETSFVRTAAEAENPDAVPAFEDAPPSEEAVLPATSPFVPPLEPTTTRREYIMTVPPLLDFENVGGGDDADEEEHVESSLEATQLTAPSEGSGSGIIPEGATNAIIISGIIGGCAVVFFAVLMILCMWRQHVSRRPIYPPPESSNSSSTSSTAFHGKMG